MVRFFPSRDEAKAAVDAESKEPGKNVGSGDYEQDGEMHNITGVRDSDGTMSYHEGKINPDGTVGS